MAKPNEKSDEQPEQMELVSLETIGQGAACEIFMDELGRVIRNICDPNTDAKKIREITISFKLSPTEDRKFAAMAISGNSKLAPMKPAGVGIYLGIKHGHPVAKEYDDRQMNVADVVGIHDKK